MASYCVGDWSEVMIVDGGEECVITVACVDGGVGVEGLQWQAVWYLCTRYGWGPDG